MNKWWWQRDCQLSCTDALNSNNTRRRARTRARTIGLELGLGLGLGLGVGSFPARLIPSYPGANKCLPQRDYPLSCTGVLNSNNTRSRARTRSRTRTWTRTRTRTRQFASKDDPFPSYDEQMAVAEGLSAELHRCAEQQ
jgi:hypothetical protein